MVDTSASQARGPLTNARLLSEEVIKEARDQDRIGRLRHLAQALGDFVAVHAGQTDIKEHGLRTTAGGRFYRAFAVVGADDFMPPQLEQYRHALGRVPVVIDHEQASPQGRLRATR